VSEGRIVLPPPVPGVGLGSLAHTSCGGGAEAALAKAKYRGGVRTPPTVSCKR
jgi:hypothetical protein